MVDKLEAALYLWTRDAGIAPGDETIAYLRTRWPRGPWTSSASGPPELRYSDKERLESVRAFLALTKPALEYRLAELSEETQNLTDAIEAEETRAFCAVGLLVAVAIRQARLLGEILDTAKYEAYEAHDEAYEQ